MKYILPFLFVLTLYNTCISQNANNYHLFNYKHITINNESRLTGNSFLYQKKYEVKLYNYIKDTPTQHLAAIPYKNTSIPNQINANSYLAGKHLIKAGNHALLGITLTILGGIASGVAARSEYPETAIIGGVMALTGFCFNISAWAQIKKAGRALMMEN